MAKCKCPINGCGFEFAFGILGWDSHIARVDNHPEYHPKIVVRENRLRSFQRDFPEFFDQARSVQRRHQSGFVAKVTPAAEPAKKASRG